MQVESSDPSKILGARGRNAESPRYAAWCEVAAENSPSNDSAIASKARPMRWLH